MKTMLRIVSTAVVAVLTLAGCASGDAEHSSESRPAPPNDDRAAFVDLYRELVETNTTASQGNCTEAAQKMADRLKAAGYPDKDVTVFIPAGQPKDGGLVATLNGSDTAAKPILLLAHLDVVEADPAEWKTNPFKLVEKDSYFYGRGVEDDKAMAAIFVDSLIRYRAAKFTPKRSIRVALTCGEESDSQINGAKWLHENRPELVDAYLALNEGANGVLDDHKPVALEIQAGQKIYQDFTLQVADHGGHSSLPGPTNAIVTLASGLERLAAAPFPIQISDVTKAYFAAQSSLHPGPLGDAMKAIAANPDDAAAAATLSKIPEYNAMMRTTCVPTKIEGGTANNALPERAAVIVNCRILPDSTPRATQDAIVSAIADPRVSVTPTEPISREVANAPPLTRAILGPAESVAESIWPGVPVIPVLATNASDAVHLGRTPVYGLTGIFASSDDEATLHANNERIRVTSLCNARTFLYEVAKIYSNQG